MPNSTQVCGLGSSGGQSGRRRQAVSLRFAIEVGEQRTRRDPRGAPGGVDGDGAPAREVDRQAAFDHRIAGDVVAAAAHAEPHPLLAGEAHCGLDVGIAHAARDQRRPMIDGSIPDLARVVVALVASAEQAAADPTR